MLVSRKAVWPALAVLTFFPVSCSARESETPRTEHSSAPDRDTAQQFIAPAGSRPVACVQDEAHTKASLTPTSNDVTAGAVTWPGLKSWATANPKDFGDASSGDYKVGIVIKAGTVVTVSVASSEQGQAGLKYGQQAGYNPTKSITFQGCQDFDTAFFGGFHVPHRQCVTLEVAEKGKPTIRIPVSFFAGHC